MGPSSSMKKNQMPRGLTLREGALRPSVSPKSMNDKDQGGQLRYCCNGVVVEMGSLS